MMLKSVVVLYVASVFILTSCAKEHDITTLPKDGQKPTLSVSKVVKPVPVSQPSPKIPTPRVIAAKPPEALDPTVVVGRSSAEIQATLGDPNILRKDSPAEVWQYLAPDCALHFFFYPAPSGDEKIVRHIAINGRSVETFSELDRKKCFNDYLRAVGAQDAFAEPKAS